MRTTPRLLSVLAATAALYGRADAAALGEILVQSALGDPLRVELQLVGEPDPSKAAECLRLVPAADAPDGLPWLAKGQVGTEGSRVIVTSATPVHDPILRFALEDTCRSRLRREYTLLLSYREAPNAPVAAAPEPPASPPRPRREARPTPPPAVATQSWTTAPGESVDSLSRALFPKDADARRRFVAATLDANPGLPREANAALPPGTELSVPDLTRLPAAPRPRVASAPPRPTVARKAEPEQRAAAKTKPAQATPQEPAPVADRLLLASEDEGGLRLSTELGSVHRTALTTDGERTLLRREQQLIMALDRITESQLALSDRIRRLEEIESALTERAIELGAVAAPPAQPAAEQAPLASPAQPSSSGPWPYAAALFAGVSLALALALLRVSRRRTAAISVDALSVLPPATGPSAERPLGAATVVAADRGVAGDIGRASKAREPGEPEPAVRFADSARATAKSADTARQPATAAAATPVDWNAGDALFSQPPVVAPLIVEDEQPEEHDSAIELAEIMVSFGRVQGAAETLAEFIRSNPKQAVTPWLKLLDVYRMAGLRPEFDALARQLNKTFNVKTVTWENFDVARTASEGVEQMPHILGTLEKTWRTRECQGYLQKLLRDNREGTRQGFPLSVIDEILMLSAVLEQQLGPYRPEQPPPAGDSTDGERKAA